MSAIKKIPRDDYLYASARVRAISAKQISYDKLLRLAEAKNKEELFRLLSEYGFNMNSENYEAVLENELSDAYNLTEKISPDKNILRSLRLMYDCHNLKSALKCNIKGYEFKDMLIPLGNVNSERTENAVLKNDFTEYTEKLAEAFPKAKGMYYSSLDAKIIDLMLDNACFEDMLTESAKLDCDYATELVKAKCDIINITTAFRMLLSGEADYGAFVMCALSDVGKLPLSFFKSAFDKDGGVTLLCEKLERTDYSFISGIDFENGGISELQRKCDEYYYSRINSARTVLCGPEVLLWYVYNEELTVKNLRIIIAGVSAGELPEKIKSKLRKS